MSLSTRKERLLKSYRVVLFVDMHKDVKATDDVVQEIEHAIRLYENDVPAADLNFSSAAPIDENGKAIK